MWPLRAGTIARCWWDPLLVWVIVQDHLMLPQMPKRNWRSFGTSPAIKNLFFNLMGEICRHVCVVVIFILPAEIGDQKRNTNRSGVWAHCRWLSWTWCGLSLGILGYAINRPWPGAGWVTCGITYKGKKDTATGMHWIPWLVLYRGGYCGSAGHGLLWNSGIQLLFNYLFAHEQCHLRIARITTE